MTYNEELGAISRKPQTVVIITLDKCAEVFSVGACTATGSGDGKCYNTRSTCQDPANYNNTDTLDLKFSEHGGNEPFPGEITRPYIDRISYLPTEIDVKKSLTVNARVTIDFLDEPDNDIGVDPYVTERTLYPDIPGTFWRKLLARNIYYVGRTITIKKGFQGLDEVDYVSQQYIIDQIEFSGQGKVSVICKDPLKRADRVKVPADTSGKVTDNPYVAGTGTLNCDDTTEYADTGLDYILIEDEILSYTGKTPTSFTGVTAGVDIGSISTVSVNHTQDKKIQQCYVQSGVNVTDIIIDILENHVGIAAGDINKTEIDAEEATWLSAAFWDFTGVITKPIKASKILQELQEQSMSNLWWDEETQKVRYKVFAPDAPGSVATTISDDENIITASVKQNEISRLSRVIIYFNKNAIGNSDDPEDYDGAYISIDSDKESADEYNETAIKTMYSRWIDSVSACSVISNRFRRRFSIPPKKLTIITELKDDAIKTADVINITTSIVQNVDGTDLTDQPYQIIKKQRKTKGTIQLDILDTAWTKQYGFIAPAGQPDWDAASDAEKLYAYIGDGDNFLGAGNDEGFYIF